MTITAGRGVKITITIEIDGQAEPENVPEVRTMAHEDPYYTAMHGEDQPGYPTVDEQ